mmetsp:Transcript_57252/g.170738  ORF Transcript_57252/g.170738 Transcript_57252/m.170738 type:complete len:339 (-) Transcript_57252:311-1327(-)|eukprot:CAMPEP_0113525538 /NCGR_PEP_ID=MMETSP0015_2-20120614/221_1 /TAXON_ID=2838 /ORGANISM="Odontella" /LENGTH=338 /DNA_ID=CAMNT_0000423723 /DNA_START=203 /DNA_END=1219 /DNA_ORIENTATION=+ /assembly_acc=CAM_ASM_000160
MSRLNLHIALSVITSTSAFVNNRRALLTSQSIDPSFLTKPAGARTVPLRPSIGQDADKTTPLSAVIYGWDGEDEGMSAVEETVSYGLESTCAGAAASPMAVALAESLSFDGDRKGSLARLAVAFSPPERTLTLDDIEHIQVLCVNENSIEIEAVICEDGGCVSLAVPVSFPQDCGPEWLEGCVLRNLDELDAEANSRIQVMDSQGALDEADLEELCLLNSKVEYPSWWIPPECDADLMFECDTIQRLLNDGEFQGNVKALARNSLSAQGDGGGYEVMKALVAAVGPAGLCLKVQAVYTYDQNQPIYTLDVLVPFGGDPKQDAESLRAAVLGAVMAAEN